MKRGPRRASATLMPVIRDELLGVREDLSRQSAGEGGSDMRRRASEVGVADLLGVLMTEADDGTIECACGRRGTWVLAEHDQRSKPFPPPGQLGDEIPVFITHSDRTQHRMHHGRVTE